MTATLTLELAIDRPSHITAVRLRVHRSRTSLAITISGPGTLRLRLFGTRHRLRATHAGTVLVALPSPTRALTALRRVGSGSTRLVLRFAPAAGTGSVARVTLAISARGFRLIRLATPGAP
jgi:hypothetical protein